MGILGAKNKVIAGDYIGGKIMHSGGKVVLSVTSPSKSLNFSSPG